MGEKSNPTFNWLRAMFGPAEGWVGFRSNWHPPVWRRGAGLDGKSDPM